MANQLTPKQEAFALEYIMNGKIAVDAYTTVYDTKEDASERITPQRGSVSSGPEKPPTRRTRPSRTPVAEEKETPPVRRTRPPKEEKADAEEKCPHGLRFGIDAEDFDKCDTCEIWQECLDVKNAK